MGIWVLREEVPQIRMRKMGLMNVLLVIAEKHSTLDFRKEAVRAAAASLGNTDSAMEIIRDNHTKLLIDLCQIPDSCVFAHAARAISNLSRR